MEKIQCKNGACEYQPTLNRKARINADQQRYAQLWEKIELPKLLRGDSR